jgi:succinyl-CoA synthetase beta subunit
MDLVTNAGGKPGICLNLRHASPTDTSLTTFRNRLEKALKIMSADRSIQVILINLLGSIPQATEVSEVITNFIHYLKSEMKSQFSRSTGGKHRRENTFPRLVIRLAGSDLDIVRQELIALKSQEDIPIAVVENLDDAVTEAVRLAKTPTFKK